MAETDMSVTALKESLRVQQQLLQKLYAELDEEREASASATSEALSMIIRLQAEKAAVKMEASQYKRIAEEKMFHAEETLAVFEDLIYQKEMEIASLEFQVEAYRCRFLSLGGFDDLGENLFVQRNDFLINRELGLNGKVRRMKSLPPILLKSEDITPMIIDQNEEEELHFQILGLEKKSRNFPGKKMEKLDERISKERSDSKDSDLDKVTKLYKEQEAFTSSDSSNIQDIFEVPQTNQNLKASVSQKKDQTKLNLENESRHGKPDSVSKEFFRLHVREKAKKKSLCQNHENKPLKPSKGERVAESQAEIEQLRERIERIEGERSGRREEITNANSGIEEVKLLKEIHEQLSYIQSEMIIQRSKKADPRVKHCDNSTLIPIMEAMLYFWL